MNDSDLEARLLEALERMDKQEPNGEIIIFTAEQAEALTQVASWWVALRGAGKISAAFGSGLKWLALFMGAWIAVKAGVLDWVISNTGGQQ